MFAWIRSLARRFGLGRDEVAAADGVDAELRDIFLAEFAEVTKSLQAAHADWRDRPTDTDAIQRLRRGFHTLKGSAPLVGANELAECSRGLELLMARCVDGPATPDGVRLIDQAIRLLPACADAIRAGRSLPNPLRTLTAQVKRLTG